jgi:tetratricopeptide (TPR) repeat protein
MKKIIVLIVCICTVLAFSALLYFIFMHHSVADYLKTAQTAMQNGNLEKAKSNFIKVVRRDKANEEAYIALAEIAEKEGNAGLAASYWSISAKLNPLSKEIAVKRLNAMLEAYQYTGIIDLLDSKKTDKLSDLELYALTKASYYQKPFKETKDLLALLLKRSSTDPRISLLEAKIFQAGNNPEKAVEIFKSLIDSKDKKIRTNALNGLGQCLLMLKKNDDAGECFKKAAETSPDSAETQISLGNYNLTVGKYETAKSQYVEMHKKFPDNLIVTIALAEIYVQEKNASEIKKLLNHIKINNRTAISAKYYLRALIAYLENKPEELKKNLNFCKIFQFRPLYAFLKLPEIMESNNIPLIKSYINDLSKVNDSKVAHKDLCYQIERQALVNFKNKNYDKAIALGQFLEELEPSNPAFIHLIMVCNFKSKRWYQTIEAADKFNKLRPDTLDYLKLKGSSLLFVNKPEEAQPLLEKLTKVEPENPDVWLSYIQALQKIGNNSKLIYSITKLINLPLNAKSQTAINETASSLLAENNLQAASKMSDQLKQSSNAELKALGWSIKSQLAAKNEKLQEAIKFMKESCKLDEKVDRLLYLSDLYTASKNYNDALAIIDKVLDKNSENPKALYRKALVYQKLKDNDKAAEIYYKLLEKYPDWSLVLVSLSDIISMKGKPEEALKLAWRAHEKSPRWAPAQFCLASREMECENYSKALRIFRSLLLNEPNNKILKNLISKCLASLTKEDINKKSFITAKLRLEELKKIKPDSKEISILEKKLNAAVKVKQTP